MATPCRIYFFADLDPGMLRLRAETLPRLADQLGKIDRHHRHWLGFCVAQPLVYQRFDAPRLTDDQPGGFLFSGRANSF